MSEIIKALVAARKEIGGAKKDKVNPAFKSKYADLGAVMDAAEPLEKHGLAFVQDIAEGAVVTVILHSGGESLRLAPVPIITTKQDAQGYGSGITYARRYSLSTALGIPQEDDDGNAASKPAEAQRFPSPVTSALEGETFDPETTARVNKICSALVDLVNGEWSDDPDRQTYAIWELVEPLTNEEKLLLWSLLAKHSKVRAKVKSVSDEMRKKATA